jgi:hypothetical protein
MIMATAVELDKKKKSGEIKKSLYDFKGGNFHEWLGKKKDAEITEADVAKGLKSADKKVQAMAKVAEKKLNNAKKKIAAESEFTDLNSLRISSARISLEAFSGGDTASLLTGVFPGIVDDVKSFFSQFMPSAPGLTLGFNEHDFIKSISKHSYMDIMPLAAFVPEGMDTTYLKYSKELMRASEHAAEVINVLNRYSLFLGQLINNSDAKLSSTKMSDYKGLEIERLKLNEELGKCFKHGSTQAETTIGKVIDRNSDWPKVFEETNVIMKLMNNVNRDTLNKKIKECVELLDIILAKVKRNEFQGMSPQGISNLSEGAYMIASELEFFAAVYYKAIGLSTSVERTIQHYKGIFKD